MSEQFEIPKEWDLSPQQEVVIGSLIDDAGEYISPLEFCEALYDDYDPEEKAAPAKLRVLVQRCREIVSELTEGAVKIEVRRNKGWRITKKSRIILKRLVD